jgi:uncharacterized membrane protein
VVASVDRRCPPAKACGVPADASRSLSAARHAAQAALLLALWAVFLALQLQKSKFGHCTWQFGVTAGAQALLLGLVTFAFVRYQASLTTYAHVSKRTEGAVLQSICPHARVCVERFRGRL